MARSLIVRFSIASLLAALIFAFSLPIGLYWFGLSNIKGRPKPPSQVSNIAADIVVLQQEFRSHRPIAVHVLNPWTFAAAFLTERPNDPRLDIGSDAIWVIARTYNYAHLKNRRMSNWHLSGAALSIWLSRNWTTDEIVAAAAEIVRHYRPQFDTSSLNQVRRFDDLPDGLKSVLRNSKYADSGEGPEGRCCVFMVGGIGESSALVAYEIFGYVPSYRASAFVRIKPEHWENAGEWSISSASTLEELKALTSGPPDFL